MACNMGEVATVEAWLDSGHHPDEGTMHGQTLLYDAAERGGPDMMSAAARRHQRESLRDCFLAHRSRGSCSPMFSRTGAPRAPLTRTGPSIECGRGICPPVRKVVFL